MTQGTVKSKSSQMQQGTAVTKCVTTYGLGGQKLNLQKLTTYCVLRASNYENNERRGNVSVYDVTLFSTSGQREVAWWDLVTQYRFMLLRLNGALHNRAVEVQCVQLRSFSAYCYDYTCPFLTRLFSHAVTLNICSLRWMRERETQIMES